MQKKNSKAAVFFLTILVMLGLMLNPFSAQARTGLELSTDYPGITVTPGEDLTFDLQIKNTGPASQAVKLSVKQKPKGWKTVLKGNGKIIHQVYVSRDSTAGAALHVKVPDNASPGNYGIIVEAAGVRGGWDNLRLDIVITKENIGQDELVTQYSELKGPSDATYNFRLDLSNNSSKDRSYSLSAKVPEGWQVSFTPAYKDQQIASLTVKAGQTEGLNVKIVPPARVKAGKYTIPVQAVSGSEKISTDLNVIITGSYELEFTTPSGRLNADIVAGKEKEITMEVRNTGSTELHDISFSAQAPQDWSVKFDPETVDVLKPGETRQISAIIKASSKAIAGDYVVSLSADTRETRDEADLRVTVKTSTLWGVLGLLIVLLVIAGVYRAFRVYGRR